MLSKSQRHYFTKGTKVTGEPLSDGYAATMRSQVTGKIYELIRDVQLLDEQVQDPAFTQRWEFELRPQLLEALGFEGLEVGEQEGAEEGELEGEAENEREGERMEVAEIAEARVNGTS